MQPLLSNEYPNEPYLDCSPEISSARQIAERANTQGYLFFRGLIPESLLDPIRSFVRLFAVNEGWVLPENGNQAVLKGRSGAKLSGRGWDDPRWIELQRATAQLPAFQELVSARLILDILAVVYGEKAAPAMTNHVWLKLPGSPEHTTRPHRDSFYLPGCPRMWTIWIPLSDTPIELGPLGIVAGSHRTNDWPQKEAMSGIDVPKSVKWATQAVKPGDVVFFGANTIHCAWSNMSPSDVRLSLDIRYEPLATKNSILRPAVTKTADHGI